MIIFLLGVAIFVLIVLGVVTYFHILGKERFK